MSHLTLEALARLVDEAAAPDERAHLEACEACRAELDALREQTRSLSTLPTMMPPPDDWAALRDRLRDEGLLADGDAGRAPARFRPSPGLTRVAAALALFVAGGATGFVVRGPAVPAAPLAEAGRTAAVRPGDVTPVAEVEPVTPGRLSDEVERTEQEFAAALDRYMRFAGQDAPDPAARLAALDNIVLTTAEALNESPADPVINGYHLTAVAQRKALIRQIAEASGEPVF